MPTFHVSGTVTISVATEVEAATAKDALEEAAGRPVMGLCHQCASGATKTEEWVTSGELDGEPTDLRVDE